VVAEIGQAEDAGVRADTWWEKIYHSDAWKVLVTIVTVLVVVLSIVALFTPLGPLLGALLAAGGALLAADTLASFLEGDISLGEFGLAVLMTVLPGGKALQSLQRARRLFEAGGDAAKAATKAATAAQKAAKPLHATQQALADAGKIRRLEDGTVELVLKMKKGWSQKQIDAALDKANDINMRGPTKTRVDEGERAINVRKVYEAEYGKIKVKRMDVDHILDLQLGGKSVLSNLKLLDRSVNRSLGAQIANRMEGMDYGTAVRIVFQ
jgi:hypothetical protein